MSEYKLPYYNLHKWTLSDVTDIITDNNYLALKYDLRVACNYKYKKFYYKFYLGDNVILEQEASNQTAHYVIAEVHIAFHKYLNQKDVEYAEFCENEKKNWVKDALEGKK